MAKDPLFQICVFPMATTTHVVVTMDSGVVGSARKPRTGSFYLQLGSSDLVGTTPARAALKVTNHLMMAFREMVRAQERPKASAPPEGAMGAAVQVPGQMPLF